MSNICDRVILEAKITHYWSIKCKRWIKITKRTALDKRVKLLSSDGAVVELTNYERTTYLANTRFVGCDRHIDKRNWK